MLCETCDKRDVCVKLCKEAETYVKQDHVKQKHLIPSEPITAIMPLPTETVSTARLILIDYFIRRKTQAEIAISLNISRQYVSKIVVKSKKIIIKAIKNSADLL